MADCKVELHVGTTSIAVEGPEAFVTSTVESWRPLFAGSASDNRPVLVRGSDAEGGVHLRTIPDKVIGYQKFENVYDSADGRLKIICNVPGTNKAEKTRNTALIYLYGRFLGGVEAVQSEEIRQACLDQGCYDPANFAQYLKSLKSRVVMNTKPGGGYDVKLTAPGRKDAKELVERLDEAD
jgi:hypothetical protein